MKKLLESPVVEALQLNADESGNKVPGGELGTTSQDPFDNPPL